LADALQRRGHTRPIESLQCLVYELAKERSPYVESSETTVAFLETIAASDALKNRARSIRDELSEFLAETLATVVGREATDPDAFIAASLILSTWVAARVLAHRAFLSHRDADIARATFLNGIDKGYKGVCAAMTGTPYA